MVNSLDWLGACLPPACLRSSITPLDHGEL
jgi:hypothetical protein